jgi:hypothetical protein
MGLLQLGRKPNSQLQSLLATLINLLVIGPLVNTLSHPDVLSSSLSGETIRITFSLRREI